MRFEKLEKDDKPSPLSYDTARGYNKLKGRDNSFSLKKEKNSSFLEREIKIRSVVPAVGTYDIQKSDRYITKGIG